jgi:hypothetical protein
MSDGYGKRHGTYHVGGHNTCWLWWTGFKITSQVYLHTLLRGLMTVHCTGR